MEEIGVLVQPELLCLSQGTADPGGSLEIRLLIAAVRDFSLSEGSGAAAAPFFTQLLTWT